MTPMQINLVQTSWAQVFPIRVPAVAIFYGQLTDLDSKFQAWFKDDTTEHCKYLVFMLDLAVSGLSRADRVFPELQELGRRFSSYGPGDSDYDAIGVALIATLSKVLGKSFTGDVRLAWTQAYGFFTSVIKQASLDEMTPDFTD